MAEKMDLKAEVTMKMKRRETVFNYDGTAFITENC